MTGARSRCPGFTLLEMALVVGLIVLVSAMAIPAFIRQIRQEELPTSANQLRSLLELVRANAAFDGLRYRIRFPCQGEVDALGGTTQPIVEREDDPMNNPERFNPMTAPWAVGTTLIGEVRCAEVRLGRPNVHDLQERRTEAAEDLKKAFEKRNKKNEEMDPDRPPFIVEPDGTAEWATFLLTDAPAYVPLEQLEDHRRIEVLHEGLTGLCWLQRPFYDEELDLFEEKNWPVLLRRDFLEPRVLTEDDVLELRDLPSSTEAPPMLPEPTEVAP